MRRLLAGLLALGILFFFALAGLSLRWPLSHDVPIVSYVAWLWEHDGRMPYRDVFALNPPLTYPIYALFGRVLGAYDDLGARVADLLCLSALIACGIRILRSQGRVVALAGPLLFGVWYLLQGPMLSLQRDYLGLLPTIGAALLVTRRGERRDRDWLLAGMGIALATGIKPSFALAALPIGAAGWSFAAAWKLRLRRFGFGLLGAVLVCGLAMLWLATQGALRPFLDLARDYWPLYLEIGGDHVVRQSGRAEYVWRSWLQFGGVGGIFVAGLGGMVAIGNDARLRCLAGLWFVFLIVPLFAGKFWLYHWIPVAYVSLLLAGLALRDLPRVRRAFALALCIVGLLGSLRAEPEILAQLAGETPSFPKQERVDEISDFLARNLQPGDTVQPLDWTGGAVHAMLRVRAPLATRFVYDFHFYHHLGEAEPQRLRRVMLDEFDATPPTWIIRIETNKPFPTGSGSSQRFPELNQRINAQYLRAAQGRGWVIFRRKQA